MVRLGTNAKFLLLLSPSYGAVVRGLQFFLERRQSIVARRGYITVIGFVKLVSSALFMLVIDVVAIVGGGPAGA